MAWFAGDSDLELSDKAVDKMEEKGWIKVAGDGQYMLDEEGHALGEMIAGQKEFDFITGMWVKVDNYDEDPTNKPNLVGFSDPEPEPTNPDSPFAVLDKVAESAIAEG